MTTKAQRRQAIREFESMKNMAELRALSKISLERQLTEKEYNRMMKLAKEEGIPIGG